MGVPVVVEIMHAHNAPIAAHLDARGHGEIANLGTALKSIGNMRDKSAGFRPNLAALNAEAAIDAMRAISVRARKDRNRASDGDRNVKRRAAFDECVADAAHWMGAIGITMRMAPGIVGWARNRHLDFELFVVGPKNFVGDRPVHADTVASTNFEVGWMEAGRERSPVHRAAAYSAATVVGSQRQRILSARDAGIFPIELMRSGFVGNPVALGIPEGASFKRYDPKA